MRRRRPTILKRAADTHSLPHVIAALMLALVVASPWTTLSVTAQDPCPDEMVLDKDTGTCVKPADEPTTAPEPAPPTDVPKPPFSKATDLPAPTEVPPPPGPSITELPAAEPTVGMTEPPFPPTPTDTDAPPRLQIDKYLCTETIEARTADLATLEATCPLSLEPVAFTSLGIPAPTSGGRVVVGLAPDYVVQIREEVPAGYRAPRVFCSDTWDAAGNPSHYGEVPRGSPDIGSPIGAIFYAGHVARPDAVTHACRWFNIPVGQENTVQITKATCPAGTSYDLPDLESYRRQCSGRREPTDRFDFTLTDATGSHPTTVDADGHATWFGVPLGPLTIGEFIPADVGEPVVFCRLDPLEPKPPDATPPYVRIPAPSGRLDLAITTVGSAYLCEWYNVSTVASAAVSIFAWDCPVDTLEPATFYSGGVEDMYRYWCTTPSAGLSFTLTDGLGTHPMATDATGAVHWHSVSPGPIEVTQVLPAGGREPAIYCSSAGALSYQPGSAVRLSLTGTTSRLVCHWHNRPRAASAIQPITRAAGITPVTAELRHVERRRVRCRRMSDPQWERSASDRSLSRSTGNDCRHQSAYRRRASGRARRWWVLARQGMTART
jgi:hypothetical protein